MDRYTRVEKPKPESPINENEIRITSSGPIRNYISYGSSLLQEKNANEIVLKAMGQAISKTVSIAEGIKRRSPRLHQDTSISSVSITDIWEPIEEGLLPVEQTRQVSMITITLSFKELDGSSPGYQSPNNADQSKYQYNQQKPRIGRPYYNDYNEEPYGQGRAWGRVRGRGQGRSWGRGGYGYGHYGGNYQDNGGYPNWGGERGRSRGRGYRGGYDRGKGSGYERGREGEDGYEKGRNGGGYGDGGYDRNRGFGDGGYERGRGGGYGEGGYERGKGGGGYGEGGYERGKGGGYERGRGGGGYGEGGYDGGRGGRGSTRGRGRLGGRGRGGNQA